MPTESIRNEVRKLSLIAQKGYCIGLHIKWAKAQIFQCTFPEYWQVVYEKNHYLVFDPVVHWATNNVNAIRWSDIEGRDPLSIMQKASIHGLKYGAVATAYEFGKRSVVSIARQDRELDEFELRALGQITKNMHRNLAKSTDITEKELEALKFARQGLSLSESADLLGISTGTLKSRLSRAKGRFGAKNTMHAASIAFELGLLEGGTLDRA